MPALEPLPVCRVDTAWLTEPPSWVIGAGTESKSAGHGFRFWLSCHLPVSNCYSFITIFIFAVEAAFSVGELPTTYKLPQVCFQTGWQTPIFLWALKAPCQPSGIMYPASDSVIMCMVSCKIQITFVQKIKWWTEKKKRLQMGTNFSYKLNRSWRYDV